MFLKKLRQIYFFYTLPAAKATETNNAKRTKINFIVDYVSVTNSVSL